MQRNNLSPPSFFDENSHGAAAGAAEPEILVLVLMVTDAALMDRFNLGYEHPAVVEVAKYGGACGIGAFIKHFSLRGFMRRRAMRELQSCRPSLLSC